MGISTLHFLDSLRLIDCFFETSAEKLFLTRTEFASIPALTKRGYLRSETVARLRAGKWIEAVPEPKARAGIEGVDRSVAPTVEAFRRLKLKFLISEDPTLRKRLKGTGVRVITTVDLIAHMAKKGAITADEAVTAIETLRTFRWYDDNFLSAVQDRVAGGKR